MGRKALCIGINEYTVKPLSLCVNDATSMHEALQRMGFHSQLVTNCDIDNFHDATRNFLNSLEHDDLAVFYFAGHGTESAVRQGRKFYTSNWLLAREVPSDNTQLPRYAVDGHSLLAEMEARGTHFNAFILDCCRDDPLPTGDRSQGGGLAQMDPKGSIVAFACQPGQRAAELAGQSHAVFTENLLKHIETPGLELNKLFIRVGKAVEEATSHLRVPQQPYVNHALRVEDAFLVSTSSYLPQQGASSPMEGVARDDHARTLGPQGAAQTLGGQLSANPIGAGDFGTVYKATLNGMTFAAKKIDNANMDAGRFVDALREIAVLSEVDGHAAIASRLDIVQYYPNVVVREIWICTELGDGGDLLNRLLSLKRLTEGAVCHYLGLLADALEHCHARGIIHFDVKLENVVLLSNATQVRLIDFHVAGRAASERRHDNKFSGQRGALEYVRCTQH
jgi:uncharacterized caspase-like protein